MSLKDFLNIDDRLKNKIYEGVFVSEKLSQEECLDFEIYDQLWNSLTREGDMTSNYYLTEDGKLGLIIGAPHIMGDYLTFEANLADL